MGPWDRGPVGRQGLGTLGHWDTGTVGSWDFWALGPGPWVHELEACGVSSIRGFEATSFRQRPLGNVLFLGNRFPKNAHFRGDDDDNGGDDGGGISRPGQTPSHHAGISYPVRVQPLTPIFQRNPVLFIYGKRRI